ncbi:nucleotide pyrophosphohydrolase [Patescibacteria group bacterium]
MSTIQELTKLVMQFHEERDWVKFHGPKELAVTIMVESSEILELFQWERNNTPEYLEKNTDKIGDEIADVANNLLELAHNLKLDMKEIIEKKMEQNAKKYPIEKSKGNNKKYTEL